MSEILLKNSEIHILWLTENYFPNRGGMAQSCDRITTGLRNEGVNIHIIHFSKRKFSRTVLLQGSYTSFAFEEDIEHTLNLLWLYLANPANFQKLSHIVAFGGTLPMLAAPVFSKWLEIPLITLLRGNDFDVSIFSARKRETFLYCLHQSSKICVVSKEKVRKIEKMLTNAKVLYIPNGIDSSQWQLFKSDIENAQQWKKANVGEHKRLIGIFGHLKQKKGLTFFLEAIVMAGIKEKVAILIAGELEPELKTNLELLGLDLIFLPFLDRLELLAYYPACDAIAIPSFYDGMPNVLLEAASLNIPVIASNIDGIKDVTGDSNLLFYPGDLADCNRALNEFMAAGKNELRNKAEIIANHIHQHFNHKIEAERYLEVFLTT
jgi:glycosyltransferase involved in cell wall biosynthesis